MARPEPSEINHGLESWDTAINDNFSLVFDTPLPVARYADFASLPDASLYEHCLAVAQDTGLAYISDGVDWIPAGVSTFLGLSDTPASYVGQEGKVLAVNAGADALEFVDAGASAFTELTDVPASYVGQEGKVLAVNAGADALEFVDQGAASTGADLRRDWPVHFTTAEQDTGLTWVDGRKIYQITVTVAGPTAGYANRTIQAHGVSPDLFIDFFGFAVSTTGETILLPHINDTSAGNGSLDCYVYNTSIVLTSNTDNYSAYTGYVTLRYVKDEAAGDPLSDKYPSYSETETATGMKWIDGRMIYRKTWSDLAGPYSTNTSWNHEISNLGDVVKIDAVVCGASVAGRKVPGFADNNTVYRPMWIYVGTTQITWATNTTDYRTSAESHVTVFYTKSTDLGDSVNTLDGNQFSMEETSSGMRWTDGRPIFKKVLRLGTSPNAAGEANYLNIPNLGQIIRIQGAAKNSTNYYATPLHINTGASRSIKFSLPAGTLTLSRYTSADMSAWGTEYVIVHYTKNMEGTKDTTRYISQSMTLNVATTGQADGDGSSNAPFDTIQTAMTWLADKWISPAATVTISVAAGTYTSTATPTFNHPCGSRIQITGYTTAMTTRTVNAVNTGTKTFTVNGVDCRTEFPAGATCKVFGSSLNDGTFTVASNGYSGGNTTIVVSETVRSSTADGSIIGYGLVNRILAFTNVGGWVVNGNLGLFNGFLINGNAGGTAQVGMTVQGGGAVTFGNNVVIKGFSGVGLLVTESSCLTAGNIVSTGHAGVCMQVEKVSNLTMAAYAAACRSSAAQGLFTTNKSHVVAPNLIASENNTTNVVVFDGSHVTALVLFACYSTTEWGIYCAYGASARLGAAKCRYNAQSGIQAIEGSHVSAPAVVATHNSQYGIVATRMSSVYAGASTLTDNTVGDSSPAVDTEGNSNSLIYSA